MYTLLLPWFTNVICKVDISVTLICPSTFVCVSSLSLREDLNVIRGPCCPKSLFLFSKGYIYIFISICMCVCIYICLNFIPTVMVLLYC